MQKEALENTYRTHHETRGRYGYLFCQGERGPFLSQWIGEGKKVLDLGCRDGMLTSFFAKNNEVTGVDIDQKALSLARERLSIPTLWLDLNSEWPFQEDSYDVIVACEILEHLFFPDRFLANVFHTLKKGGLFLGSVPNAFRMRNRWKFLFGKEYEKDPTHVRQFSYPKLKSFLSEKFTVEELAPIGGKVLPWWSIRQKTPDRIARLFAKDLLWKARK